MSRIAFLTMDSLDGFVSYDALVSDCLALRGLAVDDVSWRNSRANWDDYEMVIIRSPWDYQHSVDEFMAVLENIDASSAVLWNSLEVVRWNVRKTYLQKLHDQGIAIVPTQFIESPTESQIRGMFDVFGSDQIVIKPVIGANANDTFWLRPNSSADLLKQIETLYQGRLALLQPFIQSVVEYGETSHIFFDGQHSHSVLKTPKAGDFRVQEEHGSRIQLIQPDLALIQCAKRALEPVPRQTLYGRVDLVELSNGQQAVMELELIEPSLYLTYDPDSAARFADDVDLLCIGLGDRERRLAGRAPRRCAAVGAGAAVLAVQARVPALLDALVLGDDELRARLANGLLTFVERRPDSTWQQAPVIERDGLIDRTSRVSRVGCSGLTASIPSVIRSLLPGSIPGSGKLCHSVVMVHWPDFGSK